MANWLGGLGCVPIYHLMEDAATAEISRAQVWQWIHHPEGTLTDGRKVSLDMLQAMTREELQKMERTFGEEKFNDGKYELAARLFGEIIQNDELEEFLTLRAYEYLD